MAEAKKKATISNVVANQEENCPDSTDMENPPIGGLGGGVSA